MEIILKILLLLQIVFLFDYLLLLETIHFHPPSAIPATTDQSQTKTYMPSQNLAPGNNVDGCNTYKYYF